MTCHLTLKGGVALINTCAGLHASPWDPYLDQTGRDKLAPVLRYTLSWFTCEPYMWYQKFRHWLAAVTGLWEINLAVSFAFLGADASMKAYQPSATKSYFHWKRCIKEHEKTTWKKTNHSSCSEAVRSLSVRFLILNSNFLSLNFRL